MPEQQSNPGIFRRTLYLAATCVALGALCSGVKGGGVLFGAIVGAFLFASDGGASFLVAFLAV
jgi:hypothetical protein